MNFRVSPEVNLGEEHSSSLSTKSVSSNFRQHRRLTVTESNFVFNGLRRLRFFIYHNSCLTVDLVTEFYNLYFLLTRLVQYFSFYFTFCLLLNKCFTQI